MKSLHPHHADFVGVENASGLTSAPNRQRIDWLKLAAWLGVMMFGVVFWTFVLG